MKTKKICLAAVLCALSAAYVLLLVQPKPAALASAVYCNANYPSCYVPVPSISRLLP